MSFTRSAKSAQPIPYSTPSPHGLLISSGIPDLDTILGGGLVLSELLLLKSDRYTSYADLFLRYSCSQALESSQTLLTSGVDISKLPLKCSSKKEDVPDVVDSEVRKLGATRGGADERMKIAWRYQGQAAFSSAIGGLRSMRAQNPNRV
jgi:elongator complex protein 4